MKAFPPEPPTEIDVLLAEARTLKPHDALKARVLARARAVGRMGFPAATGAPHWFSPLRLTVLGGVTLSAVALTAVLAYRGRVTAQTTAPDQDDRSFADLSRPPALAMKAIAATEPSTAGSAALPLAAATAKSQPASGNRLTAETTATTSPSVEEYARELRILEPAREALARGNYTAALGAVEKHQQHFAHGRLTEEREALRVRALLGLRWNREARRATAEFRKRFPESVLLPHLIKPNGAPP